MNYRPVFKTRNQHGLLRRSGIVGAIALMLATSVVPAQATEMSSAHQLPQQSASNNPSATSQLHQPPRIQLAILLDTSNSMDGLIDQTRNQLWQVVHEFATAKQDGVTPILEIALFEYGNSGNARGSGYVRQLNGFTRELDAVSQGLYSLTTNGGDEYCGYAIDEAIHSLQWSQSATDIKTIFIAGNESADTENRDMSLVRKRAETDFSAQDAFHYTILEYIRLFYKVLIGGTIGFMCFHQMLDYFRIRKKHK